ncbi:MAG: hypothetical protein QOJ00_2436 [Actinomycetota bacterium]|jgi:hypothetical protein
MDSDLRDRLAAISEELADEALSKLRAAADGDTDAAAQERVITRARRAVEKAVHLLDGSATPTDD